MWGQVSAADPSGLNSDFGSTDFGSSDMKNLRWAYVSFFCFKDFLVYTLHCNCVSFHGVAPAPLRVEGFITRPIVKTMMLHGDEVTSREPAGFDGRTCCSSQLVYRVMGCGQAGLQWLFPAPSLKTSGMFEQPGAAWRPHAFKRVPGFGKNSFMPTSQIGKFELWS